MAKAFLVLLHWRSMVAGLTLLLLGAGVGLHLEQVAELSLEDATAVAIQLGQALEPRVGGPANLDDPLWPECGRGDRCADEVRQRTGAAELVYLRVLGGPTKIRVIAERLQPGQPHPPITRTLPRDQPSWAQELAELATALYPEVLPAPPPEPALVALPPAPAPAANRWVPLVPIGVGVALAGVGVGFGLSSRSARDTLETTSLSDEEYQQGLSTMQTHGLVANLLLGTAVVAVAAGVVLWITAD
ncbi:MAG: hypothetical protein IPG45_04810 [Deltaproteobacteria bacterium]|nr:hypothetical protein [Deltaproteobacteria bacterium]